MHDFAWPLAVVVIALCVLVGFRTSLSGILKGIKLRKVPGVEFETTPQQQTEKTQIQLELNTVSGAKEKSETNDPVLGPRIRALRQELNGRSRDPVDRENILLQAVAIWQLNHENARIARWIFGSQLDILLHLNSQPFGDTLANIRTFYDRAVQNNPDAYKSYSFESYLGFLERDSLVQQKNQSATKSRRKGRLLCSICS
jgi:hypothetical protein